MSNIEAVSIKIQTGVYGQFRNLNNKVWFALGEYVDNAVQSFEDNKERLISYSNGNYQFEVRINIDWENDLIKIYDNAAGIDSNKFLKAFEPANIPIDNSGLHEFGMGMKTASIWLADFWSVKTSALGEEEERFVEFDLKQVLENDQEVLNVKNYFTNKSTHFTEIVLNKLSKNSPKLMQLEKIKKHLSSIYRKYIRTGDLKLYINEIELIYEDPEILEAPFYNDLNGNRIIWKKEIKFSYDRYKATGFIAILNTMSTSEVNGLSLFRRGRVIEGSHDEKYRPKAICGQIGSPRYKRIFGELELDGFEVSFNKGSFQEQGDLEALMEALQTEISSKEFNLYSQAENFIKEKTKSDDEKVAKKIVSRLKKANNESSDLREKVKNSLREIDNISIATENEKLTRIAKAIDSHEEIIEIKDEKYRLTVELITESTITDLYSLQIEDGELFVKKITYKINLAHPFFRRFERLKNEEDYQPIISIIRSLVLAEVVAPSQGTRNAGNVRMNFNTFLRNI
ncbi:ATP-binding protein [Aquirufa regiilacus]|uniref:ATP-binding protein n=1 Tax=Aquirufa regiilacus TaxID=3024868 RepID=A0ABU3TT08_9BACT|nr:ATP-binding protein [Aquirufa sp. LEOWEIH-7C]MDU0808965.1 ATP-binding protein [Aquirufa sp. LEOWEIH-7C]